MKKNSLYNFCPKIRLAGNLNHGRFLLPRGKQFSVFLLFILVVLPFININAADEKFTATISSSSIAVGDQVQVTFSINGNGSGFKAPAFQDFNILMGPSQSSSVTIVNGSFAQTISFTYVLQALKEGTFKIGPAEIILGNSKVLSNTVTVTVTKGSTRPQAGNQQQGNQGGEDINAGGKNVFLRASVDHSSAYRGEGIVVTYRLYTKVTLLNYAIQKLPAVNGFWSQDITLPQQPEFRNENIDGVAYKSAEVKKMVVFPQRDGNLQIDPMEGEVIARLQTKRQSRNNDPFDIFNNPFFNNNIQDVKLPIKSDPVRITVHDLPSGAPAGFGGAVGKFTCEISLDKKETKAHEAVTLKVKISGKGNIRLIEAPKISFPPEFETYDPKENSSLNATAGGVTGSKTFEYLIIPRNPGEFKIPVSSFSYFDLEKKKYEEIPFPDLSIKVLKGDETVSGTSISGVSKSDIQFLGKDIRYIKTSDPVFIRSTNPLFGSGLFYGLITAPFLLLGGVILVRRRQTALQGNLGLLKSRHANKLARKRLSAAQKFLASGEKEKFLDEMFKALWGFIGDKMQIPVSELSKESAEQALLSRNVQPELIKSFTETIDSCEFSRFAGASGDSIESIYKKGIDVIAQLEDNIKPV